MSFTESRAAGVTGSSATSTHSVDQTPAVTTVAVTTVHVSRQFLDQTAPTGSSAHAAPKDEGVSGADAKRNSAYWSSYWTSNW